MDLEVFIIGVIIFIVNAFFLLFSLIKKKKLTFPFTGMAIGVVLCFIGLLLAAPHSYVPVEEREQIIHGYDEDEQE
ncbi:hypothetical protein [Desertibacillus haloalkaliphilus]|uniref:hypothetical protein n=1 Tax=Desertibacillus haloalkaliphilus TaxID=1328930 RepID=UPI001C260CDE|nr:hypothetical protein [Desertibacillus haloalkaliphilus]MBU8907378.1 hypothetical protein [Desertibacillus haloalkaliphilus]